MQNRCFPTQYAHLSNNACGSEGLNVYNERPYTTKVSNEHIESLTLYKFSTVAPTFAGDFKRQIVVTDHKVS